jgi:hyperpolarization activated cyclic nucleotide-gated potassium channel 1
MINKMAIIDEFARDANLSPDLKAQLRFALQYSTEKAGFSWGDKLNIFNELPKPLRFEVAMAMHKGSIKMISFFSNRDQVFVSTIVPFLQNMFVNRNEIVYTEDEYADEIYFIVRGRINYVATEENYDYKSLNAGGYFGDIEVLKRMPRKFRT